MGGLMAIWDGRKNYPNTPQFGKWPLRNYGHFGGRNGHFNGYRTGPKPSPEKEFSLRLFT